MGITDGLKRVNLTTVPTPAGVPNAAISFTAAARFRENIARGGINWHF
jgi:hypothetical protein